MRRHPRSGPCRVKWRHMPPSLATHSLNHFSSFHSVVGGAVWSVREWGAVGASSRTLHSAPLHSQSHPRSRGEGRGEPVNRVRHRESEGCGGGAWRGW